MTQVEIYQKIVKVIQGFRGADFEVTENLSVYDGFEDSVELMEFVLSLEDEFAIEINDDATDNFKTVGDVVAYVSHHQA